MDKSTQTTFTDNNSHRIITSEDFNFALDKESGVSLCWGKTINDTPGYDPVSPQELVFKIDNTFNLEQSVKDLNFLANVLIKISDTEFKVIEDHIGAMNNDALLCLSTVASIVLIIDHGFNQINLDDFLKYIKYINNLKISLIIQVNVFENFSFNDISKLKLLSQFIQLKMDDSVFNADIFLKNIKMLEEQNIKVSTKVNVNKNNIAEVEKFLEQADVNSSIKLYFNKPFVTANSYIAIQEKIQKLNLVNLRLAPCAFDKFNKKKLRTLIETADCDATCFSIYIENRKIYPCEFNKSIGIDIDKCTSIIDFWNDANLLKFRKQIIEKNFCK